MAKVKNNWGGSRPNTGGKREGAGRKIQGDSKVDSKVIVNCTASQKAEIVRLAEEAGLNVSQYILAKVLNK